MVGLTDYEKIKNSVKRALESVWFHRNKELSNFEFHEDKAGYFMSKYSDPKEAVTEAYYYGRQQGRLTLAKQILRSIGEPFEEDK